MLSAVVRHGSSRGSWKTRPDRGVRAGDRAAVELATPRSGARSPAMTRSSVDLPQPFGPMSATISPPVDREVDAIEGR